MTSDDIDITIGDALFVGDGAHASIKRHDKGVLYLSSRNLKDGKLDLSKVYYISEDDYAKHFKESLKSLTLIKPGDVAMSIIGTIGEPYLVKPNDRFGLSSAVSFMRPKDESVVSKYLYYWLKGPDFQNAIYSIKGGVAQGYVSLEMIRSLPFRKFPLPTQRKIASILSAYDNLIENNLRRINILEEMAQNLYREWFVKFRFPGHEKVKFVDSPIGNIPEGWEVVMLGNLCDAIFSGGTPSTKVIEYWNGDIKWLSSGETRNRIIFDTDRKISQLGVDNSSTKKAQPGDIVIASAGQGKTRGQTSYCTIETYINQSVITLRTKPHLLSSLFLLHNLTIRYNELRSLSDASSTRGSLSCQLLRMLPILSPQKELHDDWVECIKPMFQHIHCMQKECSILRQTRDLLLPKLISGELDVSDLDIDIPEDTA